MERLSQWLRRHMPVLIIAGLALCVRTALVAIFPDGGLDLRIYHYFADLVLRGLNPYEAPEGAAISPRFADMPPLNLGLFAGVLLAGNSLLTLRLFFIAVDVAIILLLGLVVQQGTSWRIPLIVFYAFNPLVLASSVVVAEDKPVIFLLLLALFIALMRGRRVEAFVASVLLTAYKWMGFAFIVPLIHGLWKSWKARAAWLLLFAVAVAATHVPFFPANLASYAYRASRLEIPPMNSSFWLVFLQAGLYHPFLVSVFAGVSLLCIYGLYFTRRLAVTETIVLSIFFAYIGAPEIGVDRIVLITLPFFFVITLSPGRIAVLWGVTLLSALALVASKGWVPLDWSKAYRMAPLTAAVFGEYGSAKQALLMNLFPAVMLFFFVRDRFKRREDAHGAGEPAGSPEGSSQG